MRILPDVRFKSGAFGNNAKLCKLAYLCIEVEDFSAKIVNSQFPIK